MVLYVSTTTINSDLILSPRAEDNDVSLCYLGNGISALDGGWTLRSSKGRFYTCWVQLIISFLESPHMRVEGLACTKSTDESELSLFNSRSQAIG